MTSTMSKRDLISTTASAGMTAQRRYRLPEAAAQPAVARRSVPGEPAPALWPQPQLADLAVLLGHLVIALGEDAVLLGQRRGVLGARRLQLELQLLDRG